MQKIYKTFGKFIGDWWWLGIRNPVYGLAYKWKPESLKNITSYDFLLDKKIWVYDDVEKNKRIITVILPEGVFKETTYFGPFFHIIVGYRLRPIKDTAWNFFAVRPINMDGRPIFSIRWGKNDD